MDFGKFGLGVDSDVEVEAFVSRALGLKGLKREDQKLLLLNYMQSSRFDVSIFTAITLGLFLALISQLFTGFAILVSVPFLSLVFATLTTLYLAHVEGRRFKAALGLFGKIAKG